MEDVFQQMQKALEVSAGLGSGDALGESMDRAQQAQITRETARAVMVEMFPLLFEQHLPQILKELAQNIVSDPLPTGGVYTARLNKNAAFWAVGGGSGTWNGIARDFHGFPMMAIDISTAEKQAENLKGEYLCYNPGVKHESPEDGIQAIAGSSPRWWWTRVVPGSPFVAWKVAEAYKNGDGDDAFRLARDASVSGDIRLSLPITESTPAYAVVQQGGGIEAGDNGVKATYTRAHA